MAEAHSGGLGYGLGVIGGVSAVRSATHDELSVFKARRFLGGLPAAEASPDDIGGLDRLRSVDAHADLRINIGATATGGNDTDG